MNNSLQNHTHPLVSIIVPVFNGKDFLQEAITSLFSQTYSNYEIIVVNDGSTDSTPTLLRSYGDKIKIINQANQGQGVARNKGCGNAKGSLFAFLDSDDVWDPSFLEKQVSFLQKYPEAIAVYCDYRRIDEKNKIIGKTAALWAPRPSGQILHPLLFGNCIGSPSVVVVKRTAFFNANKFGEKSSRNAEDYALWLALSLQGPFIYNLDTLVSYREHNLQTTKKHDMEFRRAIGNVHAFEQLLSIIEIQEEENKKIKLLIRDHFRKTLITAAWVSGENGQLNQSLKYYFRAIQISPWQIKILKGIINSIYKKLVLLKKHPEIKEKFKANY